MITSIKNIIPDKSYSHQVHILLLRPRVRQHNPCFPAPFSIISESDPEKYSLCSEMLIAKNENGNLRIRKNIFKLVLQYVNQMECSDCKRASTLKKLQVFENSRMLCKQLCNQLFEKVDCKVGCKM